MRRLILCVGVFAVGAALTACDSTTAEQHVAAAQQSLSDGEVRTAVIELKNALQKQPDDAEARFLLGEANERLGDSASALKEFERALDLGLDDEQVRAGILRAKVRLGRFNEAIGDLEGKPLSPALAVILADAYRDAGDLARARATYEQGLPLSGAHLGLGTIAWQEGNLEAAREQLDQAVEADPENGEAWLQRGELLLAVPAPEEARASFEQAEKLPATRLLGRAGLARVNLTEGDLDAAAADVAELLRVAPNFVVAHYLNGVILFESDDLDGAEAAIREVQSVAPTHPQSLYLMGAIKYRQGQLAQAEDSLQRYLAQDPDNASAAKLLASMRFDRGDFSGVVETLAPYLDTTGDPQLLAMNGTAELRRGNASAATRSLEQAVALAPDMAPFRNQLALSLLAAGDQSRAESELQGAIEVDGDQFQSDYLLAMVHIRDGDWAAAREAVEALVSKNPESPMGYNLRGVIALANDDRTSAQEAFSESVARDPQFLPAVRNLAQLAQQRGEPEEAARIYQDFLANNPGDEGALLELADLALRSQDRDEAIDLLQEAVSANPESIRGSVALAGLYAASGELDAAEEVLAAARESHPDSEDLLALSADLAIRRGDREAAEAVASQLQRQVSSSTPSPALLLSLGRIQAQLGDTASARRNLERALGDGDEQEAAVRYELARLALQAGRPEEAGSQLADLQAIAPDASATRLLEGDIALAQGKRKDAAKIYSELAEAGVREGVVRLAGAGMEGDSAAAVEAALENWVSDHPEDIGVKVLQADVVMRRDPMGAVPYYESLAGTGHPVVLNNLAWLYLQKGDGRATEVARAAAEAAPDNAEILDTLGWVMLQQGGDRKEAVEVLRRSRDLRPGNPTIQYHLAVAMLESGDPDGARSALLNALESPSFPEAAEAQARLEELAATP